jgi:hypothetical protein
MIAVHDPRYCACSEKNAQVTEDLMNIPFP